MNNHKKAIIKQIDEYENPLLRECVYELLDRLGGKNVKRGDIVVIKPNLLAPSRPEQAVCTHPEIIRHAAFYYYDKGARVRISDSPAVGSFRKIISSLGLPDLFKGTSVEIRPFRDSVKTDIGPPFGEIELAREALECDHLVNLPKLKTHSQMLLTLGVKNLFGCIVGMRKPQWHLRTGVNRVRFAELLYLISRRLSPSVTILDGIVGMEGDGPGKSGTPRRFGILAAGNLPLAVDIVVCMMAGLSPDDLLTNRIAMKHHAEDGEVDIVGSLPRIANLSIPSLGPVVFGPAFMHGFMRRHLTERPVLKGKCLICGECWNHCPAGAINKGKVAIEFDYDKCIRCYCCMEVCPHGALHPHEPLGGRLLKVSYRLRSPKRDD
jgi:uncharacterized protein (DUF362 family)/Pyruvate/2-oxoacid:ferredoxin oxidoreductase delta subunit